MKKLFTLISILTFVIKGMAQTSPGIKPVLTADSLKSGNSKDVLTSFFQLAFDRFTSDNKELAFTSNPFAIMLKSNPALANDKTYYKYRTLRKTNFSFSAKLDSSYRFNGFSSGIKYALIDKRDSSTSKLLFQNLKNDSLNKEVDRLQLELVEYAKENFPDKAERKKFVALTNAFLNKDVPFNQLDTAIQKAVKKIIADDKASYPFVDSVIQNHPSSNILAEQNKRYEQYKDEIKNGLLWTIGASDTTYNDHFFFSNVLFNTELVKGIGKQKPGSNWEFNIKAGLNLLDDTLSKGRDLKRSLLNFEPGFNWVIRNAANDQSFLELKFSSTYYRNFKNLYAGEKRDSLTLNTTIRVRIISDIWLPLEIKYDPRSGNVFGFLNVRANFKALGKLAKELM